MLDRVQGAKFNRNCYAKFSSKPFNRLLVIPVAFRIKRYWPNMR